MKLFALHLKLVKYIQQEREGPMLILRKIQGITLQIIMRRYIGN